MTGIYKEINGITPTAHQTTVLNSIERFLTCTEYDATNIDLLGHDPSKLKEAKIKTICKQANAHKAYLSALLQGRAGVGKTTVTQWIAEVGMKLFTNVCIAYPTHKAGTVLRDKLNGKFNFSTLASLVGLSPNMQLEYFNPNQLRFQLRKKDELPMDVFDLILIDEASMIQTKLFDFFMDRAKQHNIKVLFIGHKAQLPGINEGLSKVFTDVQNVFYLNEVIRQKPSNPNVPLLTKLEEDILLEMSVLKNIKSSGASYSFNQDQFETDCKLEGIPIDRIPHVKGPADMFHNSWRDHLIAQPNNVNTETGEGYQCMNEASYKDAMKSIFVSEKYDDNRNLLQIYNYTNKSVGRDNRLIRSVRNPDDHAVGVFDADETIMAYNNLVGGIGDDVFLNNSEEFVITKIEEIETRWKYQVVHPTKVKKDVWDQILNNAPKEPEAPDPDAQQLMVRANDFEGHDLTLKAYAVYVKPVNPIKDDDRDFENNYICVAHPDSYTTIAEEYYKYFNDNGRGFRKGMRSYYGNYNSFKELNVLLQDIYYHEAQRIASTEYSPRFVLKKDIDRAYACTIHKSQGSTKDYVGVNLYELNKQENYAKKRIPNGTDATSLKQQLDVSILFKKLLYVGWSRSSKFAFICVKQ